MHADLTLPNGMHVAVPRGGEGDLPFLYTEIFESRCYEQEGIALSAGSVVLDVGANVGLFALRVMQLDPQARIYCFEPVPSTFSCLVQNTAGFPAIRALNIALAERPGSVAMTLYPRSPGNATSYPELKLPEARAFAHGATLRWVWRFNKVAALALALLYPFRRRLLRRSFERVYQEETLFRSAASTLDEVFEGQAIAGVDLLKIDVEGAERDVLAGLSDEHLARVRQLVVELTPHYKVEYSAELEARLRRSGFTHVALRSMLPAGQPLTDAFPCTLYARRPD